MEQIIKNIPSSDYSLKLESMKSESQVIGKQQVPVNILQSFVHTARHTMRVRLLQIRLFLVLCVVRKQFEN